MRNHSQIPLRKSAIDQTLDRAVQRIYETYGSDLTRFFAAVQRQRMQDASEVRKDETDKDQTLRSASDQSG